MGHRNKLDYSLESLDEIRYRLFLAEKSVNLYYYFGHELKEVYEDFLLDETPEYKVRAIVASYSFIQIAAIFIGSDRYSLKIQNQENITIGSERIRKIFPVLPDEKLNFLLKKLKVILKDHQQTIKTILGIRHNKIAHMGKRITRTRDAGNSSAYSFKNLVPRKFAYIKILYFIDDMRDFLHNVEGSFYSSSRKQANTAREEF